MLKIAVPKLILTWFIAAIALKSAAQQKDSLSNDYALKVLKQMNLTGYAQFRYQRLEELGKIDGFDVRRARLDLKGKITEKFNFRLQTDFAVSVKMLDAILTYKYADALSIQAGQFKVPLSLESNTSAQNLDFINRSQSVEALTARGKDVIGNHNGRDVGVMVSGNAIKISEKNILEYSAGIFNGQGINTLDLNESKDGGGRILIKPVKGLKLGGSTYIGYDKIGTENPVNKKRNRYAGEVTYTYDRLIVQGEYIQGEDCSVKKSGYYGYAGFFVIRKKLQLLAKYDFYDSNTDKDNDATTYYIGGLNYFFNDNAKVQVNYEVHDEEGNEISNNALYIQLQLTF